MQRRPFLTWTATVGGLMATASGRASAAFDPAAWERIEGAARGQTVHFNAWGGSARINAYLQWAAGELKRVHGVELLHVKLADTAEMVRRVRAEKAAGRREGSADLVWINGENFLAMKRDGLLFGPFAESLPNFRAVDTVGKPTTLVDFGEPVAGYEAAWGMAQLTFFVDTARAPRPEPASLAGLLAWAKAHPGRFTYPRPPQFVGTTFLKQALAGQLDAAGRAALQRPHTSAAFDRLTPPLWAWLEQLHPHLWRGGAQFPAEPGAMRQMLADGELAMSLTFNPNEPANHIADQTLPATVEAFQLDGGTIGNTHFVAIPFNARAPAGAQVVANFLQSAPAQARKADIAHWGDPTVLALDRLAPAQRALFRDPAQVPGAVRRPAPAWSEPHASWVEPIETAWQQRHGGR
ncbi:MAG: ABC transporter substrate-binding protein [Rubrivivax sp.]